MLVKGSNKKLPERPRSILVIQLGDLGDVVLTTPTLGALQENFPGCRLVVALRRKARGLLEGIPWITDIIYINKEKRGFLDELSYQWAFFLNLRKHRFHLAFDLRTGTRGAILSFLSGARYRIGRYGEDGRLWRNRLFTHLVRPENELDQYCAEHGLNILAPFGIKAQNRRPSLLVSPDKKQRACIILKEENVPSDKPLIAIQPFSLWRYKDWAAGKYVDLIHWIRTSFSLPVIIIGSADERPRAAQLIKTCKSEVYNLAGRTSLGELKAILVRCNLLIGGDSAGMHIASAVGTPTISIFGPSSPVSWAPRGEQHHVIKKDWSCVPCRDKGCQNTGRSRCLEALTLEEVKAVVEKQILGSLRLWENSRI